MGNPVLDAARRLGPSIAGRSREIEDLRTLPGDIVDAIRPTHAFRLFVPPDLGGPGVTAWEGLEAIEEFAYHDGSVGWCVAIAATSSLMASYLPAEHARAIYGDPDSITGGFAAPMGRAHPVAGGLAVTGRWQWGSGTRHCTWVGGGCLVVNDDGEPTPTDAGVLAPFTFFDPADVEFHDTWDAAGLAGTGSCDYSVEGAFVPEGRWVQIGVDRPTHDGPLGAFSFYGLLAVGIAATATGVARRAVDELVSLAAHKRPQGSSRVLAERAPVQADVARAEARVASAWALVADVVGEVWEAAVAGSAPSDEHKRRLRLASTHATHTAAAVTADAYTAGGGAAVYRDSPLQRCFRDAHVATQHAMVAPRIFELAGRLRLDLETDTRQL